MRLSWPLTGRSEEIHQIEDAITAPEMSGMVIRGVPGVGKSRLARAALSGTPSRGWETRWVVGTSSARGIPLGAFTAWMPTSTTDTVSLVRGLIDSLAAAPPGKTAVLGVDDVHLLDELSVFVVHQIVQRHAAKVVLTAREGSIPPAVQEIWKVGQFDEIQLRPMSADETATLLTATLGGSVDPHAAQRLWQLTRGNSLYLRNIVEQEVADGRLAPTGGCWRWNGDPIMPPSLIELIESRMGTLPSTVSDVVDVLAVAEPIGLAALQRITDVAAVEEADRRGLVTVETTGSNVDVRVAHPLYGEVRRRRAPATGLRRLRGMVAQELAESDDRDDIRVVVRRATLSLDSDLPPDADLLVRAAYGAIWLADLPLADRLAKAAVRAGAGPEPNFVRAHALSWLSRGAEAEAVLAGIAVDSLTDAERGRLAFLRASNMLWALGDPVRAKQIIDDASHTVADGRSYIDAFLTVYWFAMDQPDAASEAAKTLVLKDLPEVVGTELAALLAAVAADAGRLTEAVSIAEAGYDIATRSLDAPHMRANIADAHVSALVLAGRLSDALDVADREREQAANLPGAAQPLCAAVAGRAALAAGRLDRANSLLGQATTALSAAGHDMGWGFRYLIPRTTALAMHGNIADAITALTAIDGARRPFRALDFERSLARAWVLASQGAISESITVLRAAAERASANGRFAAEVVCLQTATQFGDRSCAPRLRELTALVEGPRVGVATRFADALHDGDGAALESVSGDFERMGDLVAAVDAAAHAALCYRNRDLRGSALRCSARADALAQRCGGVHTPALRQASNPVPLTDREREIVMLIGLGLSNREVADRLTLSVRTVESHIYRAMAKTGTTNRDELAGILPRSQ